MKLGNTTVLLAKLKEHYNGMECYLDDNEVVWMADIDGRTRAYLTPSAEGWLTLRDARTGNVLAELEVEGAGFEAHELGAGATRN